MTVLMGGRRSYRAERAGLKSRPRRHPTPNRFRRRRLTSEDLLIYLDDEWQLAERCLVRRHPLTAQHFQHVLP